MLEKSLSSDSDTLIYDLEDSVAPDQKSIARQNLVNFLAVRSDDAVPDDRLGPSFSASAGSCHTQTAYRCASMRLTRLPSRTTYGPWCASRNVTIPQLHADPGRCCLGVHKRWCSRKSKRRPRSIVLQTPSQNTASLRIHRSRSLRASRAREGFGP